MVLAPNTSRDLLITPLEFWRLRHVGPVVALHVSLCMLERLQASPIQQALECTHNIIKNSRVQVWEGVGREQARDTGIRRKLAEECISAEHLQLIKSIAVREEECSEWARRRRGWGRVCVWIGGGGVGTPRRIGAGTRRGGWLLPRSARDAG